MKSLASRIAASGLSLALVVGVILSLVDTVTALLNASSSIAFTLGLALFTVVPLTMYFYYRIMRSIWRLN